MHFAAVVRRRVAVGVARLTLADGAGPIDANGGRVSERARSARLGGATGRGIAGRDANAAAVLLAGPARDLSVRVSGRAGVDVVGHLGNAEHLVAARERGNDET
jgi:hypothetical protein